MSPDRTATRTPTNARRTAEPVTRMSADERRELVLEAATRAFARGGFHGTSTDAVAREAGVSQPYVVRIFGTKLELFLEVFEHSVSRIRDAFAAVLDEGDFDSASEEDKARMGIAYSELLEDRDFLQVMMHGFSAGAVEEIAAAARRCMGEVFATIKRTGWDDEQARDFVAYGMLLNVMLAMRATEHVEVGDPLSALTRCAFGDDLSQEHPPASPTPPSRFGTDAGGR